MKLIDDLKARGNAVKKDLTALYYAYQKPGTGWFPKLLILIALGYALSPFDLIPDFIPILGYLDDLLVVPFLIGLSIRFIPEDIFSQCRKEAEEKHLKLGKNWVTGIIFITLWVALIVFLAKSLWGIFSNNL